MGLYRFRLLPISSTPTSSTPISSTVIYFNKVSKINFFAFYSKFLHCISYFISFSKKIIDYLYQKDIFTKGNMSRRNGSRQSGR